MCLAVLAWRAHPRYRLIVAANRDEYHARATAALAPWADAPVLAGRDLEAGGAWLGIDRGRRFGLVTNYRELARRPAGAPSRGRLIPAWFACPGDFARYAADVAANAPGYAGFNLLVADRDSLHYASNRAPGFARALPPGVHG
ncbi:MAG: NRDE family protein, partial [Steroidobacteraceae bacterium]